MLIILVRCFVAVFGISGRGVGEAIYEGLLPVA